MNSFRAAAAVSSIAELQALIESLEAARARALVTEDWHLLDSLISPDLVHIHANGAVEDRAGYFEGVRSRIAFQRIERESLTVRAFGTTAVATGVLKQTLRLRETGTVLDIRVITTQVWTHSCAGWQQTSFHATHLPSA